MTVEEIIERIKNYNEEELKEIIELLDKIDKRKREELLNKNLKLISEEYGDVMRKLSDM